MLTIISFVTSLFAQLIVALYPGVLIFWLIIHSNIEYWRRVGTKAYAYACIGFPAVGALVAYFQDELFSVQWRMSPVLVVSGVLAFVTACVFGWLAAQKMPWRTLLGLPELKPHDYPQPLLNTGIYARTRNPIYFAHWLVLYAAAAVTGFAVSWALFALDCVVLPLMIREEQKELQRRYGGEYEAYRRHVPAFFPKLT
jgi:protein-S-isoprenylcysteine O-methyltransferase Ste14